MATQWEKVYVFISSTFNDMHAERDYLVKQVFPELREWCEKRKLGLVDIDLRWGVTEQDALHNKNVVKVCLDRIDDCRPFFLCFLGQRRGWVPGEAELSPATLEEFPGLKAYAGNTSVTEMEILHALVDPLHRGSLHDPKKPAESYQPVKYAFFYLRDNSYLSQLPNDPPLLRQTYTNEGIENEDVRTQQDAQLKQWRENKIPATGRPARPYQATWNPHLTTPELLLPTQCPSSETTSLQRWQHQWAKAGVTVTGDDIQKDPNQVENALRFNQRLTSGRLADFQSENQPLHRVILHDLQTAIIERYPKHVEIEEQSDLQKEIDQQEQFLYASSEGFISRGDDFKELDAYVEGDEKKLFVLTAPGGMGKSTLLANWIEHYRVKTAGKIGQSIHFRFIGQSDRSTTVYSLLQFLMRELKESARKLTGVIPDDPQKLRQELPKLLEAAGKPGRTVIVLDALNQLETGLSDLSWLPFLLPENIKLVVSFKRGEPTAEETLQRMQGQAVLAEVKPFANMDDRRKLVQAYLTQYLKDLDERHLETLINSDGAENPLYLKVVLSELRVFGAFANLGEKIRLDFGKTPISAFEGVLKRLENDPAYSPIEPHQAVPHLFGLLAHARQGLSAEELTGLFLRELGAEQAGVSRSAVYESVQLYLRQVRPFLAYRDGSYDFFFESFRLAAQERYVGEESPKRLAKDWHRLLAEYFMSQPLKLEVDGRQILNRKKLSDSTHHQALAGLSAVLVETFTDFKFMQASISVFGPYKFINEFELLASPLAQVLPEVKDNLLLVRDALQLSAHILVRDATQCSGQLIGRLQSIPAPLVQSYLEQARAWWGNKPWLDPANVHFTSPGGALSTTLTGEIGGAQLYALPDGKQVLTVSGPTQTGQTVRIWDLEKKTLAGKYERVSEATVTPDGRRAVLFYSHANQIDLKVLDPLTLKETQSITGQGGTILAQAISPDGRLAVTVSHWGSTIKTWDPQQGREISSFNTRLVDEVIPLSNGRIALLLSEKYSPHNNPNSPKPAPTTISVWDTEKQECLFEITPVKMPLYSYSFMVTPDAKIGLFRGYKDISVWNMENGAKIGDFACAEPINSILLTPDGTKLVSCAKGLIQVWDLAAGKELHQFQTATLTGNMAMSPDGNTLAAVSANGIEVWDLARGELLASFKSPDQVRKLHFLPNEKGLIVEATRQVGGGVTAPASQHNLRALELKSGMEIYALKAAVYGAPIVMTPDRRRAAAVILVGKDGKEVISTSEPYSQFIVWDLEEGKVLPGLSGKQTGAVEGLSISPDGHWILSGSTRSGELKCWNVETGNESSPMHLGDLSGVDQIAWLPGGQQAISGSSNYMLTVWDLEQGRMLHSIFTHKIINQMMNNLLMSADGKKVITISTDGRTKIWDLWAGSQHTFPIPPFPSSVQRSLMTPDGQKLISITNSDLKVWDIEDGAQLFSISPPSQAFSAFAIDPINMKAVSPVQDKLVVTDIATGKIETVQTLGKVIVFPEHLHPMLQKEPTPTPDSQALLAISGRQIIVWDLKTGAIKNTLTAGSEVSAIALSPDGNRLFSSSRDTLQVWDMGRLEVEGSTPGDLRKAKIVKILVTPDGKKAISGADSQPIKVWDLLTRELLFTFPNNGTLSTFSLLPDGQRIIFSSVRSLKVFDLETGLDCLDITISWGKLTVSPDGKFVLMMYGNELIMVELVPGAKRRVLKEYEPGYTIDLIEITPDGRQAVISLSNHKEKKYSYALWDLQKGVEHPLEEDTWVRSIEITNDGKRAVLGSQNQIKVWNLENGKEMHRFDTLSDVNSFGKVNLITPDGKTILSPAPGKEKTGTKIWDLESGAELSSSDITWGNMAYLQNVRQFLSSSYDNDLRAIGLKIIDLVQLKVQVVLEGPYDGRVQKIMLTPDSRFAISVGLFVEYQNGEHARQVEVWDLQTGKIIANLFMDSDISAFTISPDSRTIIVGDMVGQVHFLHLEGGSSNPGSAAPDK